MQTRNGSRLALGLALLAGSLNAQSETLDEIIVTATRRPISLLDYPGSVSRMSMDTVALTGATHASELLNRAPGTMIQRGSGQESLTALRSPVLTGAGACGAVLVLEDGIPIRPVGSCNVNELFEVNVEQAAAVELMRGPGSALYGSSAVHGIINVIPPRPEDLPALGIGLEAGDAAYRRIRLVSGSSTDKGGFGFAMHATDDGGWREASGFTEQKLNAVWTRTQDGQALTMRLAATNLDQETAGFIEGKNSYRDPVLAHSNPDPEAYRDARSLRASLAYENAGGLSARAYVRSSRMDFLQHFLLGQPVEDNGQDSGGLMLSFTDGAFAGGELMLGYDMDFAASTLKQHQDGPTTDGSPAANAIRPAGKHYDYAVDSSVIASYAQWRRPLSPQWSVEAALRYEQVRYDYNNRMIDGNTDENGVPCPGGCLYSRPADRSDDFGEFAPRLGLVWRPRAALAAWLSLARGFRAPEATELYRLQRQQSVADLAAERIDAVELGLRLRGGNASLDLAAYHMDKEDVILRDSAGFNVSGGSTRHRGIEYQGQWSFLPGWSVEGAGSYADHEYRFTAAVEQGEQITTGNEIDTAPRNLHALRLRHGSDSAAAELEWLHIGAYWTNAANTARYGGHDLFNLRFSLHPAPRWSVTARVTNLLDVAYADRADFAFGNDRYFPGRDRAYFIELDWQKD